MDLTGTIRPTRIQGFGFSFLGVGSLCKGLGASALFLPRKLLSPYYAASEMR